MSVSSDTYASSTGFVKDVADARDATFVPCAAAGAGNQTPGAGLPSAVDFSAAYPPALDQGMSNTCTANATANALLYLLMCDGATREPQSRLFIYWIARVILENQSPQADAGIQIRDAMKAVAKYNSVDEKAWPFDLGKLRQEPPRAVWDAASAPDEFRYLSVPQDEASIKAALARRKPVVLGIRLLESFYSAGQDGYVRMSGGEKGWHAVAIVGYNDATRRFKLQNSWGPRYGSNGFFYLDYDWVLSPQCAADLWALEFFSSPTGTNPPPPPVPPSPERPTFKVTIYNEKLKKFLSCSPEPGREVNLWPQNDGSGRQVWTLTHVNDPTTYTVQPAGGRDVSTSYMSVNAASFLIDLFVSDDGSGRQRFKFEEVGDPKDRKFMISVPWGMGDAARTVLTGRLDGTLVLEKRRGIPRQIWKVLNV